MGHTDKIYKSYKRPPIIEAVIEARFSENLSDDQLQNLIAKQKKKFTVKKIEEIGLKISHNDETGTDAQTSRKLVGYKIIEEDDSSNIIQIKQDSIVVSRIPPYEGWEKLLANFKKYYDFYTNKKFRPPSRIGVRYINRIDIPSENKLKLEDYCKVYPYVPKSFPVLNQFAVQTMAALDTDRILNLNVYSALDNPLLGHVSIIFDTDVTQSTNLPVSSSKLYDLLGIIRDKKDTLFEDLLTTKCKKLFK